jgi:putative ABC transport system permease protein
MSGAMDIKIFDLALGFVLLAIPISLFIYFRIGLVKDALIGVVRMVVQLSAVALYLEWIFKENNAWINMLWVLMMVFVGVFTTINRAALQWRYFVVPLVIASLTSAIIIDIFFLGLVVKLDYFFDARYFIPITGMVLGNALNHNIVGLSTYFTSLSEKSELYFFLQTNTSSTKWALRPFIKEAVVRGLNPLIASMTVIGLISLPGMMTGQILGGSSPAVAIRYQIMIMLAVFVGCTINLFLSILFSNRFIFNEYGKLNLNMLKPKTK